MLENCEIKYDREVHLNITGHRTGAAHDEKSVDGVWVFEYNTRKAMFFFECKDVNRLGIRTVAASWNSAGTEIALTVPIFLSPASASEISAGGTAAILHIAFSETI